MRYYGSFMHDKVDAFHGKIFQLNGLTALEIGGILGE